MPGEKYTRRFGHSSRVPYLSTPVQESPCRVCHMPVLPGSFAWSLAWSIEHAHLACGWFTGRELSSPGNRFETAICRECALPLYIHHAVPGPWKPRPPQSCMACRAKAVAS